MRAFIYGSRVYQVRKVDDRFEYRPEYGHWNTVKYSPALDPAFCRKLSAAMKLMSAPPQRGWQVSSLGY